MTTIFETPRFIVRPHILDDAPDLFYRVDVLACPRCEGRLEFIAVVTEARAIRDSGLFVRKTDIEAHLLPRA